MVLRLLPGVKVPRLPRTLPPLGRGAFFFQLPHECAERVADVSHGQKILTGGDPTTHYYDSTAGRNG